MLEVSPKTCVFSAVQHGFLILFPLHLPLQTDLPQAAQGRGRYTDGATGGVTVPPARVAPPLGTSGNISLRQR